MERMNKYIDQTILRPDATEQDIRDFLKHVIEYRFCAAVVNPCWVPLLARELPDGISLCSVVGFPLGASSTKAKVYAAGDLIQEQCHEIDMVMNIGMFKQKAFKYVKDEISAVARACQGRILKVIIETCLLEREEKVTAAKLVQDSGAQYVKTSTGFAAEGAQLDDVELLRATVGPDFGVKASGGIRTYEQAIDFIRAGASRLGTSSGVQIMNESAT
jgi:deoxyribose-phosphate aldolase